MGTRIVMHTPEPASGAARYVSDLVIALLQAGEAVVVFCPRNFAYTAELLSAGAQVAFSGERSTRPAGLAARVARNFRFFLETSLRQVLLTRPGDIVHFQFPLYFPAGLVPFLLARIQACGVVFTAHDPVPHKWLLPEKVRFIERGCLRCAYSLSHRIVVHSPAARDLIARVFSLSPTKITEIAHGATLRDPAPFPYGSATLDLLMFGSIRENKGVELAIEAIQNLNAGELRVRLLIAGAVANAREREYWDACKAAIERAPAGITVLEQFVPDEAIGSLLAECHAVLLPYKNFESDSGVAAVALASGRAILASDIGSLSILLSAADLGIAIRPTSVAGVQRAIQSALEMGKEEIDRKGVRGLAFARSARSWDRIGKQTANLYAGMRTGPVNAIGETKHV